jgi:hypothetical protein
MPNTPKPSRPPAVRNIALANGVIAALCLTVGFFLVYTGWSNPDQPFNVNAQCLTAALLILGIVYAVIANEFYNLRPWTYPVVRTMHKGALSPIFSFFAWYDAIDSDEMQRAFGVKPTTKSKRNR